MHRLPAIAVAVCCSAASAVSGQSSLVAKSPPLFEYHSAFWVNLHHFLYEQARGRRGMDAGRPIVAAAVADTAGMSVLSAEQRRAWDAALSFYERRMASHDVLEREMARIKAELGDEGNAQTLKAPGIDDSLRAVLNAAAPAYRAGWWNRHDSRNRAWIARIVELVEQHGATMSRVVAHDFNIAWSDFVIRVDASAYSNWGGAYTTVYPDRITFATSLGGDGEGASAIETMFHESLHTLDDSVRAAMTAAAGRHGKQLPSDVTHAMIFYTAGDAARREFPGYEPYAIRNGIWTRGTFPKYLPLLEASWQPWLDGKTSFAAAIDALAAGLP